MLLALIVLAFQTTMAEFTGTISMSNSEIEATGVTYTFQLRFIRAITDPDAKIVIRFPSDFETQFTVTSCQAGSDSGLQSPGTIDCAYVPTVRLLTVSKAFPTTFTEIKFDVVGVTNPKFAA